MKKNFPILVSLVLLTACTSAPADSVAATPEPTATPVITLEPTPSPTPAPTMAVYDEVSFDDWRDGAGCTMPDYTFSAPHKPQPQEQVTWPTDGVTLCYNAKTLEEAAEIFHTTVENLKELNPDWQDKYSRAIGCYWALKVQADPYTLPMNNVVTVTVNAPWVESYYDRTEVCDVPASLDKQARAALASAYYFQYHWWGMHAGFLPYEKLDEPVGFFNYRAADGAFYTKFSEFGSFLHTVYSDAWVDDMLSMDPAPFAEGENDTILTLDGDRGGNIAYCGHLFTEPELQPDGSLAFWQLSLTCESDDFKGWAGGGDDCARYRHCNDGAVGADGEWLAGGCAGAAQLSCRGRALRGCERRTTVEWNETGARTMFAPAGQTTARACLLANCRRSLCADKRPARGLPAGGRLPYSCGPHMCGPYKAMVFPAICLKNRTTFPKNHALC